VIRCSNYKRSTAEVALKDTMDTVLAALKARRNGTAYDVLRDISHRTAVTESGNSNLVREGLIRLTAIS